jgi:hypothetical protein
MESLKAIIKPVPPHGEIHFLPDKSDKSQGAHTYPHNSFLAKQCGFVMGHTDLKVMKLALGFHVKK